MCKFYILYLLYSADKNITIHYAKLVNETLKLEDEIAMIESNLKCSISSTYFLVPNCYLGLIKERLSLSSAPYDYSITPFWEIFQSEYKDKRSLGLVY